MIQRFGSDRRLHVHLHALFLDGAVGGDGAFFPAPAPSPEEVEHVLARIVTRAEKLLDARADALSMTDEEPALAHAHREATSGRGAVGHTPEHDEVQRLLEHLCLFTEPIPVKNARDPPELWTEAFDFDGAAPPRRTDTLLAVLRPAPALRGRPERADP